MGCRFWHGNNARSIISEYTVDLRERTSPPSAECFTLRLAFGPDGLDVFRIAQAGGASPARTASTMAAARCIGSIPSSHGSTHLIMTDGMLRAKTLDHSQG
jgi:hypothetical protein